MVRVAESALAPAEVVIEHVARYQSGSDPAGDGRELTVGDQTANVLLGAAKLRSNLAYGQGCRPVHPRSIAARPARARFELPQATFYSGRDVSARPV
jgi:hypothetical protein